MSNFRKYANIYWLKNPHDTDVEVAAQTFKDINSNASEEPIDLDDPINMHTDIRQQLKIGLSMYLKIKIKINK